MIQRALLITLILIIPLVRPAFGGAPPAEALLKQLELQARCRIGERGAVELTVRLINQGPQRLEVEIGEVLSERRDLVPYEVALTYRPTEQASTTLFRHFDRRYPSRAGLFVPWTVVMDAGEGFEINRAAETFVPNHDITRPLKLTSGIVRMRLLVMLAKPYPPVPPRDRRTVQAPPLRVPDDCSGRQGRHAPI